MPWQGGTYIQDGRSPLDRLYGYQETMAKMQAMKHQQDLMRERQKILSESLTPAQAGSMDVQFSQQQPAAMSFPQIFQQQLTGGASANMLGAQDPEQVKLTQTEAKPAQFDAESAIARLYGAGDLEGAQSIINDQYKDAMGSRAGAGGAETWAVKGRLVRGQDGQIFEEVASNRGNVKLRPVGGELVGQNQVIRAGGKTYIKDAYSNETREVIDTTMTPDQIADNDPVLQGKIAEAKASGAEKGESDAKGQAAAESSIPVYDKTLGIIGELINHPGRAWGTGGSALMNVAPGTPGYDFKTKLAQLSGQNFLTEIQRMKGQGSLSDSEGKRLESASAALDAAQSEPEFLHQLMQLQSELQFYKQRAESKAAGGSRPAPGQPQAAPKPSAMPSLPNPAQHKGRIVRDTSTGVRWQSNGAQWVRVK